MKSEKYGTYYGKLKDFKENDDLFYAYFEQETKKELNALYNVGVKEILLDVKDGDNYSDTLFFEIDENTDLKKLMLLIVDFRPDEFSEETPNHFRMWFD